MYFDPVSSWLVVLIINGVELAEEKIGGRIAQSRSEREYIKERNKWLNAELRKIDDLDPEAAFRRIERAIKYTHLSPEQITIRLANQDYIITILEKCAKKYSEYSYEEAREKAAWYQKAASEAKQKREQHMKQLKEKKEGTTEFDAEANATGLALVITAAFVAFILVIAWII